MAQSREEINRQKREENPQIKVLENGQERILTPDEYERVIEEWVGSELERQQRDERRRSLAPSDSDKEHLEDVLTKLQRDLPLTPQENTLLLRTLVKDLLRRS